ncbi:hypothetical protein ERC79_08275 [Rhodococcus sp. ABRD24]|nr:hypothetical protein ERC79_08275 [Rhodococcus sp. ABRD24]
MAPLPFAVGALPCSRRARRQAPPPRSPPPHPRRRRRTSPPRSRAPHPRRTFSLRVTHTLAPNSSVMPPQRVRGRVCPQVGSCAQASPSAQQTRSRDPHVDGTMTAWEHTSSDGARP